MCSNLGGAIFLVTLRVWIYLLRKSAYSDNSHIILKAHTISNKLVSKVSAQKKGGEKVMTATNMCSNFGSNGAVSPQGHLASQLPGVHDLSWVYIRLCEDGGFKFDGVESGVRGPSGPRKGF